MRRVASVAAAVALAAVAALTSACSSGGAAAGERPASVRLGYFANVTHATAIAGVEKGFFRTALGDIALKTQVFSAGPAAVEALFAGSLDAAYLGPNPAINAFVKSDGEAVRVIAGATSGGASLVVREGTGITGPLDLKGKRIATPQLGNTQDIALRAWLSGAGLKTSKRGDGDVTILNQDNATTLETFRDGTIDAAWVPEPWASRLVLEGDGEVLVDERTLWPAGSFVTTHLAVRTAFLDQHPDVVQKLLVGHVEATQWITGNLEAAKDVINTGIERLTQKRLADTVIDRAFTQLTVTNDPIASSLQASAAHAVTAGLLDDADLHGIYDLTLLNDVLTARGLPLVADGGLGTKG